MEFKIYQDREKIADTGDINRDYRVLFPQTTTEAVHYKNDFTDNNLKSALDYLVDTKSCVIVSEDKPTNTVGDTHWMKILGTYNNGTIGNIYLTYVLNHNLRNHDGTVVLNQTENVICKNGEIVTPTTKNYDGYLPETQSKVEISENGQIIDCYYDEEQYNVSYVLNGGTNNSSNPSTVWYTDDITLKNATKTDSTFAGWYLDSGFATKISKLNKISKDITLYAKFTDKQYGITYVLNGGTNASSNPNVITQADTVTLANATKSGSTFEGWYSDSSFTTKVTVLSGITSDITLYAKFTSTSSGSGSGSSGSGSGDASKVYLYSYGDENIPVTGGWNGYVLGNEPVGSFTKEATYMELKTTNGAISSSSCSIGVKTANSVLGSHTKVCVKYTLSGNTETYTTRDGFTDMNYFAASDAQVTHIDTYPVGNDMVGSLEIYSRVPYTSQDSSLNFMIPATTLRIYEVWLENDDTSGGSIPGALIEDDGTTENSSTMTFTRLMPTSMGTIAQSSSGRWYGWGRNYNGTLQYRKNDSYFTSYAIESCKINPYADENANMRIDVASVDNCTYGNSAMSLVIDTNGNIWLLGKDEFGIDDSYSSCIDWTQISNNTKFTKVASCGYGGDGAEVFALMAIDKNGNIWMQGDNRFYLGDVNTTVQTTFFRELTQVTQGTKYIDVSLYNKYALMIDENNNLYQVGKSQCPSSSEEYREPTILMSGTKFKKVYCSIFTSAAITTDGTLYVWGRNIDGQLGNGNADDEVFAPIKYPISEKVKSVSIGYGVLFVLTENGNIYVSGENSYHGILGLGSVTKALTPTKINVDETFIDLSFNTSTVVAIDSKGKLWEWGYYAYILGDPTDDVNVPQKAKFAIGTAE